MLNPEKQKYDPGQSSKAEQAPLLRVNSLAEARVGYENGKLKLNFEHTFSDGTIFRAIENAEGVASIQLLREGKPILDFAEFIPEGYRFVTPTGLERENLFPGLRGEWFNASERKLLGVGDIRSAQSIFFLLHEIAHTHQKSLRDEALEEIAHTKRWFSSFDELLSRPGMVTKISRGERQAWSWALRIARKIKKETGVNVLEIAKNFEELEELVCGALLTHRFSAVQRYRAAHNKGALWKLVQRITGTDQEGEDLDYLRKLFDKGKYSKK